MVDAQQRRAGKSRLVYDKEMRTIVTQPVRYGPWRLTWTWCLEAPQQRWRFFSKHVRNQWFELWFWRGGPALRLIHPVLNCFQKERE
jgi:hypothetical protein